MYTHRKTRHDTMFMPLILYTSLLQRLSSWLLVAQLQMHRQQDHFVHVLNTVVKKAIVYVHRTVHAYSLRSYSTTLFIIKVFFSSIICWLCHLSNNLAACYVFPSDGVSCMVTTVESLILLCCSKLFWSRLFSSTRGSRNPFTDILLDSAKLPDTEFPKGMLVCTVEEDIFCRGGPLEPVPSTLDACVRLLYVLRMTSSMVRRIMIPMTMTAIIAPELWVSICSLDLVVIVVLENTVVKLVTGETVEVIFNNIIGC